MPNKLQFDGDEGYLTAEWRGAFLTITTSGDGYRLTFEDEADLLRHLTAGPYAD